MKIIISPWRGVVPRLLDNFLNEVRQSPEDFKKYFFSTNANVLWFLFPDVVGLRAMVVRVPEAAKSGSTVTLGCDYDLENTPLYSVKWYRGDEEFYRYVPKESPPTKVFATSNINVDVHKSNSREVTLHDIQRNLTGFYKCEVSADAPLFHTDIRLGHMMVVEIPEEGPILSITNHKVAPGSKLRANCTAPMAYPAVNLTWYVNGEQVGLWVGVMRRNVTFFLQLLPQNGIHVSNSVSKQDYNPSFLNWPPLEVTSSRLLAVITSEMLKHNRLKLKCIATLFTLYRRSDELEVVEDAPQLALIRRPTQPPPDWRRNSKTIQKLPPKFYFTEIFLSRCFTSFDFIRHVGSTVLLQIVVWNVNFMTVTPVNLSTARSVTRCDFCFQTTWIAHCNDLVDRFCYSCKYL